MKKLQLRIVLAHDPFFLSLLSEKVWGSRFVVRGSFVLGFSAALSCFLTFFVLLGLWIYGIGGEWGRLWMWYL